MPNDNQPFVTECRDDIDGADRANHARSAMIGTADGGRGGAIRLPLLRWTYGLTNRIVMTTDCAIILLSCLLPHIAPAPHIASMSWAQTALLGVVEAAVFFQVLLRLGNYRVECYQKPLSSVLSLIPGLLAAWVIGALFVSAFHPAGLRDADLFWYWHAPQALGLLLGRQAARMVVQRLSRDAFVRRNVVIIGANPIGEAILARLLSASERVQYAVVGVFADASDARTTGQMLGVPIIGDINTLAEHARSTVIDVVIVALPLSRARDSIAIIEDLQWLVADVVIPIDTLDLHPGVARLATIAGVSTLQVLHRPLKGSQALLKIAEDYVLASVALVLASPVMLLAAIAIRLDSKGPLLFVQERSGFNNNSFWIYKFRTMTVDPNDDGAIGTLSPNDPRITRVGRILRRLSLDELPQLLNVLRGEMSIVGPRPYVPNMLIGNDKFRDTVRNYAFRHRLKPGITGLAQANGLRGNALRSIKTAERSVELDLHYIMNWSIWLDLQIMVRTVLVAMTGPNVF